VVARWNDIMNSSARAIEASTYSGPSTSRRIVSHVFFLLQAAAV
jgi:hypothetical protein